MPPKTNLSPEELNEIKSRSDICRTAARARWNKQLSQEEQERLNALENIIAVSLSKQAIAKLLRAKGIKPSHIQQALNEMTGL